MNTESTSIEEDTVPEKVARADSRDMIALHTGFRREYGAIATVVRAVPDGDVDRAAIVAKHVDFLFTSLHVHHSGEDEIVWPLLLARTPDRLHPIVAEVEAQHERIHRLLDVAQERLASWREEPFDDRREALAQALDDVVPALRDHLELEEREIVPLIDEHLSAAEWASVAASGQKVLTPRDILLIVGMAIDAGTEVERQVIKDQTPTALYLVVGRLGPWLYRRQRRAAYGTAA